MRGARSSAHDPHGRAGHLDVVPGLRRRARHVLERLALRAPDLERLAGRHPVQLELRPHPRHRAGQRRDVQRSDRHAGYGSGRMASRSFLILHGLQGSGPGHWQTWLGARLRADGERVAYPDLPDADLPSLAAWRGALDGELAALPAGELIVICHSLACLLWLHHIADGGVQADRALLAAPPSEQAGVPEIEAFFPVPLPALPEGS